MRIVHTVVYEVEKMTVRDFLADHQYRMFMERPDHEPSSVSGNMDWLHFQRWSKKLYVVNDRTKTHKICADNQRGEQDA